MKKLLGFVIIMVVINISVLQNVQAYSDEFPILAEELCENVYLTEFFGEKYFFSTTCDTSPRKYEESEFNFFLEESKKRNDTMYDYIKAGDYYMARERVNDFVSDSYRYRQENHLFIYNNSFELVKDCVFDSYVYDIGYCNGEFYIELYKNSGYYGEYIVQKSDDFENWIEFEGDIPIESNGIYVTSDSLFMSDGNTYDVKRESDYVIADRTCGGFLWTCESTTDDKSHNLLTITMDNIYYYRAEQIGGLYRFAYQYDDKIYFTNNMKSCQESIPVEEINSVLEQIKNAPYVIYDSTVLAFEQPPVIENDRTLIPIRFLFEQMGATVDWDGDTQTATISQDNTTITFAIDNTEADINGQTVVMDVPARLINGKTMVPLRFLSENLGNEVNWDGETRIITIK